MIYIFLSTSRRRDLCASANLTAAESSADSGEEGEDYTPYCKRNSHSQLVDQMELVNLNPDGNYGAMWKARPPSYTATTAVDHEAEPPQARTIRTGNNVVEITTAAGSPARSDPAVGAKLASLSTFRAPDVHVYESPKFVRRESSMGDMREIAVSGRENS